MQTQTQIKEYEEGTSAPLGSIPYRSDAERYHSQAIRKVCAAACCCSDPDTAKALDDIALKLINLGPRFNDPAVAGASP